jgi:hypothetical protein
MAEGFFVEILSAEFREQKRFQLRLSFKRDAFLVKTYFFPRGKYLILIRKKKGFFQHSHLPHTRI